MSQPAYARLERNRNIEGQHYEISQERASWCTVAKAKRAGLFILEVSAPVGAVALGVFTNIHLGLKAAAFAVSLMGADSCKETRKKIRDFQDPVELQSIKEDALRSTFQEVILKYTWSEITDYQLLPEGELARKCQLHVLRDFESFSTREVNEFLQRSLITEEQYAYFEAKDKAQYKHTLGIPVIENQQPEEAAADPVAENQQPEEEAADLIVVVENQQPEEVAADPVAENQQSE